MDTSKHKTTVMLKDKINSNCLKRKDWSLAKFKGVLAATDAENDEEGGSGGK